MTMKMVTAIVILAMMTRATMKMKVMDSNDDHGTKTMMMTMVK